MWHAGRFSHSPAGMPHPLTAVIVNYDQVAHTLGDWRGEVRFMLSVTKSQPMAAWCTMGYVQRVAIGAAAMWSSSMKGKGPVCRTAPPRNRSPSSSRNQAR